MADWLSAIEALEKACGANPRIRAIEYPKALAVNGSRLLKIARAAESAVRDNDIRCSCLGPEQCAGCKLRAALEGKDSQ